MKKLLMTTAVLVALIGNSHADPRSLPSSMHGLWCNAGKVGKIERYVRGRCKKDESDDFLEVGVAHVEGHEWGCDFRKVVIVGRTYKVSSKCGGEGMLSDEEATIWLDGLGTLVCAKHRSTPLDSDPDPVVRTVLNFEDTFAVTHVSRSGKAYVRGDQYRDVKVWDDEKGPHWSGIWKRNPNKRMTGTLVYEGNNNRYIEETYDGGRLETTTVSTCEKEEVSTSAATLAIAAPPVHGENSVLRSLPTSVQKSIKEIRERCLAIERENPPYGTADDDGLITFTLSGAQAVLVDELSFCGGQCYHGVNCATGFTHLVEVYVRSGSVWRKAFSKQVTQPIFVSTENDPHTGESTRFRALVIKIGAEDKRCPAISSDTTEWKRRSCDFVVKWDGAKFTFPL